MRGASGVLATVVLMTLAADTNAQTIARSFDELQGLLEPSSVVFVTDTAGRETWGRVIGLSPSALTLQIIERQGARTITRSEKRTFASDEVALVVQSDVTGERGAVMYPASWHRLEALPADTPLLVVLESGERREYRLASLEARAVRLVSASGAAETLEKARISRVLRPGFNDPAGNGIVIGAAAGAGSALALTGIQLARCGPTCNEPDNFGAWLAVFTASSAGLGAFAGWIIDRAHKGTDLLFPVPPPSGSSVRLVPELSLTRQALVVSIRF